MLDAILPKRTSDAWGSGEFGASRGSRVHKGVDYSCYPDTAILSLVSGVVTKLGYPYADALEYRYVEVTDGGGFKHRWFYVEPACKAGDEVEEGDIIGTAQDIAGKYSKPDKVMLNHVHYEILKDKTPVNPEEFHL